jgi:TatD DNase family protein
MAKLCPLTDSHCHVHAKEYNLDASGLVEEAHKNGISDIFMVGTTIANSVEAVEFANLHEHIFAIVGIHPHEAKHFDDTSAGLLARLIIQNHKKIVAVGEIGLDYFYGFSEIKKQQAVLLAQLELAERYRLPCSFHVRGNRDHPDQVFEDFWAILSDFPKIRGVLHSFTANTIQLSAAKKRKLLIGVNGILTFSKDESQLMMLKDIDDDQIVFETDAPYLTPKPHRGKVNKPSYVRLVAEQIAQKRNQSVEHLSRCSQENIRRIFY